MFKNTSIFLVFPWVFSLNLIAQETLKYPKPRCSDQTDVFHGVKVKDPFRWMEDIDSPETRAWIDAEVSLASSYFNGIPERDKIKKRLSETWNYQRFTIPEKVGSYYVYSKNDGLQNQNVLYKAKSPTAIGEVFFDPNTFAADGTVTLGQNAFTDDGKIWAYSLSASGSDRSEWKFKDLKTGALLKDTMPPNRYEGFSWIKDGSGFFYVMFPQTKEGSEFKEDTRFAKVYFHKLGTPIANDPVVYERPEDGELVPDITVSDDGRWLVIFVSKGTERMNEVAVKDLKVKDSKVVSIVSDLKSNHIFVGNDGADLYFVTDRDAPRGKLAKVNVTSRKWTDLVKESKDTLQATLVGNRFFLNYLSDAHSTVKVHDLKGAFLNEVKLPGLGTASGFEGKRKDNETFYSFASFNVPPTIFRYDLKTGKSSVVRETKFGIDLSQYEVKQVFYKSKDGTKIPMFITHKKGLELDGQNPTLLYGYGGFNISITPSFSASRAVWLEMGGVYAVANIRGGAEYGKTWWEGGSRLKKQNVFDDFIAAGEWLIANKYTSTPKLAIEGRSNGGLLVGATLNQRPDLFGAAIAGVGVMDMIRFDKFTIGYMWKSDYGSTADADDFKAMYAYSPYHNAKCGTHYPATLITTADHDVRVFPAHSFKYAAAMQSAQKGTAPVLIRIETKAGHGAGKPVSKIIEETADIYAFLYKNLGMFIPEEDVAREKYVKMSLKGQKSSFYWRIWAKDSVVKIYDLCAGGEGGKLIEEAEGDEIGWVLETKEGEKTFALDKDGKARLLLGTDVYASGVEIQPKDKVCK